MKVEYKLVPSLVIGNLCDINQDVFNNDGHISVGPPCQDNTECA